jgi:NarL family two-component system sensor histidine kinase YdfH
MQHIQRSLQGVNPFRWTLLLWVGLVYLWGIQWGGVTEERVNPHAVFLFTLFMLLHFSLYGVGTFLPATFQWLRLLYFAVQVLLIFLIGLVSHHFILTLGLYLALMGEMASLLLKIRMTLLAGVVCLVLFSFSQNLALLYGWEYVRFLLAHIVLPYILPVCLLVVGYALLFTRQTRAHSQTRSLLSELERAHQQLADYAIRIEELTRAAERQRMARELHDTLAQGLAGLILQLEAVKSHLIDRHHERALQIVMQAMERARTSLATARSAIDDLRRETIPLVDLQYALEEEIGRFTAATSIPCTTYLSSLAQIPAVFYEDIVRIVAEGLMNAARHAQAHQVWVCVAKNDQDLDIEVRDDGTGFDSAAMREQGHYGLLGLRERARLLGGQFALRSAPGEGTTIRILLPVTPHVEGTVSGGDTP